MKIAFIVSQFPVVSETFILNQITGLLDRGHEVDIFAESQGICSKIHADVEKYNLSKHTYYLNIPVNKFFRYLKGAGLIITNFHKKPAIILKSLNILAFGRKAATLHMLYNVIRFLDKGPYGIVHCHFGPLGIIGSILKDVGVVKGKVVTSFYGYDISRYIREKGEDAYDYLFSKSDLFLPLSNQMKDELIRLGCNRQKVVVHRIGVDINRFNFLPRKLKNNGKVNLLTIARLVEKKGVQYSVDAVAKVIKKHPDIEYNIVGDGPLKSNILSLINKLKISNNAKLLGWKTQEEIIKLMKDVDILLVPSVTAQDGDQEGTPAVLMEALAQGIPVISTYHSGIPELVQDGISGFLVPERDTNALAEKIIYLLEHQEIWAEMGKAGRKYVEENFDTNKLNDRLIKIYQQLLNGKVL
jgi:colanic acid/amylovoran biosynthesis glycosyltransferase